MTPQQVLEQFRLEMGDDVPQPALWGDDEILRYLTLAQDQMAKALGGIADAGNVAGTSALCTLALTADTPYTVVSPYVLRIRSGRLSTGARDVQFLNESDLPQAATWSYGRWHGLSLDDTDTGAVEFGVLGMQENSVRWVRVPEDSDTCALHVFRLPYPRLTGWNAGDEGVLEVAEDLHMDLIAGMRARAYLKQDAETYDKGQADRFREQFAANCDRAKQDYDRRRYRPRTVMYGGL